MAIGLSMAATAMVARRVGEKNPEGAAKAGAQATLLCFGISIVIGVVGFFMAEDLLRLMGADPRVIEMGHTYTRTMLTGNIVVMLLFQLVFLYNFIVSLFRGQKAGNNPWRANTLEWTTSSPPPHGNWAEMPTVYRGPYEYSVPGRAEDFWPQNEK